jgi:putative tryptophan/tyrosine transport system substrate-binding protein
VGAEAGTGNAARMRSTRVTTSDTAASYAISDEQGARKMVLDNRQRTAVNRAGMAMKIIVLLLASLAVVSVHLADAQQPPKKPLIGVLVAGSPSSMESRINAFQKRLRELGYDEGQNVVVEYHYAEGNYNRLTAIATDLVRSNANVIVTWAIPVTQVVKNATNTIPIVMAGGGNPVETGLVESLAKPGGNITGLATIQNELTGKRLELLKEAVPKISRVAFLFNPEGQVPTQGYEPLKGFAQTLKISLEPLEIRKPNEIDKAFAAIPKSRVDGLLLESDPVFNTNRLKVITLTAKNRLPAMYPERRWAEDGGLMAYGTDLIEVANRAAIFVDKILKGAKPADLPVEQPTKFELAINLKTAKQIGVTIPQSVLFRADRVIK